MKITNKRLVECVTAANSYLRIAESENKLTHALKKFAKLNQDSLDTYNESLVDTKIDHASLDEKKNLIKINNEYVYTPQAQKKLNAALKALFALEIEIVPVSPLLAGDDIPEDMPKAYAEVFYGLVLAGESESESL